MTTNTMIQVAFFLLFMLVPDSECCLQHEHCVADAALCLSRQCVAAEEMTGITSCAHHGQCRTVGSAYDRITQYCRGGKCFKIKRAADTARCSIHDHCNGETLCINQVCVEAEKMNYKCPSQGYCKTGERCIENICYRPKDPGAAAP